MIIVIGLMLKKLKLNYHTIIILSHHVHVTDDVKPGLLLRKKGVYLFFSFVCRP